MLFWGSTDMVGNVETVVGQPDTVPAHLVDQVFSHDDDLLAAVLDSNRTTGGGCCSFLFTHLVTKIE